MSKYKGIETLLLSYKNKRLHDITASLNGADGDIILKNLSTELRWSQYTHKEITREQAVQYAIQREERAASKKFSDALALLDKIEKAPVITEISIDVVWRKSANWGYCPAVDVEAYTADKKKYRSQGAAKGTGYDKLSAAVAEAFNAQPAILKYLVTMKEAAIAKTSNIYISNEKAIAYGVGLDPIPTFHGGVGMNCFTSILAKAGFTCCEQSIDKSGAYTYLLYRRK